MPPPPEPKFRAGPFPELCVQILAAGPADTGSAFPCGSLAPTLTTEMLQHEPGSASPWKLQQYRGPSGIVSVSLNDNSKAR